MYYIFIIWNPHVDLENILNFQNSSESLFDEETRVRKPPKPYAKVRSNICKGNVI